MYNNVPPHLANEPMFRYMSASAYPACLSHYPIPSSSPKSTSTSKSRLISLPRNTENNSPKINAKHQQLNSINSRSSRATARSFETSKNNDQSSTEKIVHHITREEQIHRDSPDRYAKINKSREMYLNSLKSSPAVDSLLRGRHAMKDLAESTTRTVLENAQRRLDMDMDIYMKEKEKCVVNIVNTTLSPTMKVQQQKEHVKTNPSPFIPCISELAIGLGKQMNLSEKDSISLSGIIFQQMGDFGKCSILSKAGQEKSDYCELLVQTLTDVVVDVNMAPPEFVLHVTNFYKNCLDHLVHVFFTPGGPHQPHPVRVLRELDDLYASTHVKVTDIIHEKNKFFGASCHFVIRDLINVENILGHSRSAKTISNDATFILRFIADANMVPWVPPTIEMIGMPKEIQSIIPFMHNSMFCIQFTKDAWSPSTSILNNILSIASSIQDLIKEYRNNRTCTCKDAIIVSHLAKKR